MIIQQATKVPQQSVQMEGAVGCRVRQLVGESEGAPNFAMRHFEVEAGGHTPRHQHNYEHEVFVLEGNGVVCEGDQQHPITSGDVVFVPPNEVHQFRNSGKGPLRFLCLIPHSARDQQVHVVPPCTG